MGRETIQISSRYPWGINIIEEILMEPSDSQIIIKNGRKKLPAHCITSTTHLSTMFLNTLYDSYDTDDGIGRGKRELFRLHRCLAPLKLGIVATGNTNLFLLKKTILTH